MTLFQIVALPLVILFLGRSAQRALRGDRPRWFFVLRALVFVAAAVTIFRPDLTNRMAHLLGIGRGADLLAYVVAIVVIWGLFFFYYKAKKLESDITRLVRHLALEEASRGGTPAAE